MAVRLTYHGSPFANKIMSQGFRPGGIMSVAPGQIFSTPNLSFASTYGSPVKIATPKSAFSLPSFNLSKGVSGAEVIQSPKAATRGMEIAQKAERLKNVSPTAAKLLAGETVAGIGGARVAPSVFGTAARTVFGPLGVATSGPGIISSLMSPETEAGFDFMKSYDRDGITSIADETAGLDDFQNFATQLAAVDEAEKERLGIVDDNRNVIDFLSDLIFTPAGTDADVTNLPNIDITDELDDYYEKGEMMPNVAEARDRNLLEKAIDFIPLVGEKSLSGILLNALQSGKDKLTGFRDAVGRKFNIRTGMQEPRGAIGTGGYGVSRPGNTLTNQTRANRAEFTDFYSNFQGGAQHQMGKRVDDVISRTAQGRRTRSDAQAFVDKYGSKEQKDKFNQAKAPKAGKGSFRAAQDEGTTGSSKIVCTMMNKSYGFGSFRNKIWMKFHKNLSPEYQKGYHKIFLPLVKIAKKNKIVKKILEHIAVHSTIDMRQSMRGKKHLLGRLYRKIILPICYWAGKK